MTVQHILRSRSNLINLRNFSSKSLENINCYERNNVAVIQLNRPKALNAITSEMFKSLYSLLSQFQKNKSLVIFKGNENFVSAGGDVKEVVLGGIDTSKILFKWALRNYRLVHNYQIPYIPLIHGINFGGAADFTISAKKYRVATETADFAMPECKIGFFVDNGSSYSLSRLSNNVGFYIALTAARVKGYDLINVGLADYFIDSSRLVDLENELIESKSKSDVDRILKKFSSNPPKETELHSLIPKINKCFAGNSVEKIYENLHLDGSQWAKQTVEIMNKMSPTSLKMCHKLITLGKQKSLEECLKMEYRLALNYSILKSDIHEGARAVLFEKDNKPKWNPKTLQEVKDEHVNRFFEPFNDGTELTFEEE